MSVVTQIRTPTGPGDDHHDFHRLMPHLRVGKIDSSQVFARVRLATIPLDFDVQEMGVIENAAEKLREGRAKGVSKNDKALRRKEGSGDLLRSGQRKGKGKNNQGKGQLDVQEGREAEKTQGVEKARQRKLRGTKVKR